MFNAGVKRPKVTVAAWAVVTVLLAGLGLGVEDRLHRTDLTVAGTPSDTANRLSQKHFGDAQTLVVMLEGPPGHIEPETRRVAAALDRIPHIDAIGPWAPGASKDLRPKPGRAIVLVRAGTSFEDASETVAPKLRRTVDATVKKPVHGYITGYSDVASGVHTESVNAMKRAELVAAPLLLIVLLLVFRSPVAAALPLMLGQATIVAGRGLIDLANRFTELDVVALNMASMMGLALGVDYSLVLVSRFREELASGRSAPEAARIASRTAGHTILFAGLALGLAMVAANFVAPGDVLVSSGIGVLASVVLSVVGAALALPAVLTLLGPNVNRWSFGRRTATGGGWGALVLRATSRPTLAAGVILVLMGLLAAPALGLTLGSPDPRALPASSPQRQDFEHIYHALGGGWSAPYEITVAAKDGTITRPDRLRALADWQQDLTRDKRVRGVFGPAPIAARMQQLDKVQESLAGAGRELKRAKRDQARLGKGLARVDDGVGQMQAGLAQAVDGARSLASGADQGGAGAKRLDAGLRLADAGAQRLLAGLREAGTGAGALETGSTRLVRGSGELERGLRRALARTRASQPQVQELRSGLERGSKDLNRLRDPAQQATAAIADAKLALERMLPTGKADPNWIRAYQSIGKASGAMTGKHPVTGQPVEPGYDGMDSALAQASAGVGRAADGVGRLQAGSRELSAGLARLATGAARLHTGAARLEDGTQRLAAGIRRLRGGGGDLASGLQRLRNGGDALAAGADRLANGADRLAGGLNGGAGRVNQLASGVGRMRDGVAASRSRTDKLGGALGGGSVQTGMFESGFLPLAALDSAPKPARTGATFAVNLDRGGDAAHIVVMRTGDPTVQGDPLRKRLTRDAERIGKATGSVVAVGGPATLLQDFPAEAGSRLWLLVLALTVTTYLVLVPVLRSLLLPLLAVALNLLTVFAALGVLALGFQGAAPLGGPGNVDAIMVLAIFGIVFGLSIDYEVFLLARMREGYLKTGTTHGAIEYGLKHTAGVITGAALIMTGVFASFAMSGIASMRELGVGLTVAVLLDATVVRLILMPAVIRLAGDACWWLPRPLARLLGEEKAVEEPETREPFARFGAFASNGGGGTNYEQRERVRT